MEVLTLSEKNAPTLKLKGSILTTLALNVQKTRIEFVCFSFYASLLYYELVGFLTRHRK